MFEDNPTRKQIIMLLKKNSQMPVAEISKHMGITPMAVRQHLISLEKRGIISYKPKKYGIGRPVFLYSLTDRAMDIFPKSYGVFIKDMLGILEEVDGRNKVDRLFQMRKDRIFQAKGRMLEGIEGIAGKVKTLAALLNEDGYMVELEEDKNFYRLKQFNCLISSVAGQYPEACKYELQLYRDFLGKSVDRVQCQADGEPACVYDIPKS
jgi:predicted ArsR family transcriptional regulator